LEHESKVVLLPDFAMSQTEEKVAPAEDKASLSRPTRQVRRSRLRKVVLILLFLLIPLIGARMALPRALRWYVNRTIDRSPTYEGRIGDIDVHLWKGGYTIHDVRLVKRLSQVPVPLFAAKQIDLAVQWKSLFHGRVVGRMIINKPELNFVDAPEPDQAQTGVGPWLQIIQDLFPFKINGAEIKDADIHFRAYMTNPPVDAYLSHVDATIDNLTNIYDETAPMYATVNATGMAMDQANFQYKMKLDPFSYKPTFHIGLRLIGLDVTKINQLARTYGMFDFEKGFFDLVIETDCKEGRIEGYVKPLFRDMQIFGPKDIKEDNVVEAFWEALVGTATGVLTNQPRNQFGTRIPFTGEVGGPQPDLLASVGNLIRNAFVRAYLPRLEGVTNNDDSIRFEKGSILESDSVGEIE
jgi:uncharacterized protein DUF748